MSHYRITFTRGGVVYRVFFVRAPDMYAAADRARMEKPEGCGMLVEPAGQGAQS